jgi:hypothetical protein
MHVVVHDNYQEEIGIAALIVSSLVILAATLLICFTPVTYTYDPNSPPGRDNSPWIQMLTLYLATTFAALLTDLITRKPFPAAFLHFQAMTSLVPLSLLCTAASFLSYARFRLGSLPLPNRPDPGTIGLGIGEFLIVWLAALVTALVAYIVLYRRGMMVWTNNVASRVVALLFSTALWICLVLVRKYDPLFFFNWLCD